MKLNKTLIVSAMALAGWSLSSGNVFAASEIFDDPTPTSSDFFGRAVAMSGNYLLVSAPGDDTVAEKAGQVHLFNATTGALLHTFEDPTPEGDQLLITFGFSVALDGNYVLIGDPGQDDSPEYDVGQAHLFDATTGGLLCTLDEPTPNPTGHDDFGYAVAIQGNNILIGSPGHRVGIFSVGEAHLFDATTCLWEETYEQPLGIETFSHEFGTSVAIDGNNVLVGAPSNFAVTGTRGQAHLFDIADGSSPLQSWNVPVVNPPSYAHAYFGNSVDIDGDNVLVAASTTVMDIDPGDDEELSSVGRVYMFDALSGDLVHTLDDPTPTGRPDFPVDSFGDRFGERLAIDGDKIIIGAFGDNTNGQNVGQAHLFDAASGNLLETYDDPNITSEDSFGIAVAILGNTVLIGATGDDTNDYNIGQAHLIDVDSDGDGIPDDQDTNPDDDDADDDGIPDGQDPDTVGEAVDNLPPDVFGNNGDPNGQRNAILAQLEAVEALIVEGDIVEALQKLDNLRKRVDGCPPLPEPGESADNNDWIIVCDPQREVRELIDLLITNLGG